MSTMYLNQIVLDEKGKERNRSFLQAMLSCDEFSKPSTVFSVLRKDTFSREREPSMTPERYCAGYAVAKGTHTVLLLGARNPFLIVYGVGFVDENRTRHHLTLDFPYNQPNLDIVSRIYRSSFGIPLEDEPFPDWLPAHHERLRTTYPCGDERYKDAISYPEALRKQDRAI